MATEGPPPRGVATTTAAAPAILRFQPWQSGIDAAFWARLAAAKLNVLRLCEAPRALRGSFGAAVQPTLTAPLTLDVGSLLLGADEPTPDAASSAAGEGAAEAGPAPGGTRRCGAPGALLLLNTLERFKAAAADPSALLSAAGAQLLAEILSGAAEADPSKLNRFAVLCFADLKKYHFYYWVAFPSVPLPAPALAGPAGAAPLAAALGPAAAAALAAACDGYRRRPAARGTDGGAPSAWLLYLPPAHSDAAGFPGSAASPAAVAAPLTDWAALRSLPGAGGPPLASREATTGAAPEGGAAAGPDAAAAAAAGGLFLAYADPCPLPAHPGWPLRNLLLLAALRWAQEGAPGAGREEEGEEAPPGPRSLRLRVLAVRDRRDGGVDVERSTLHDVELPPQPHGWPHRAAAMVAAAAGVEGAGPGAGVARPGSESADGEAGAASASVAPAAAAAPASASADLFASIDLAAAFPASASASASADAPADARAGSTPGGPLAGAAAATVGWEANERGRRGPRRADLGAWLDPQQLAEQAVDLNLRLMRWRLLPALDTQRLAGTRALLLGAGTLGCAVARNLLAWGIRTVTFVDSGAVSYSNPVRQSLFEHGDCLEGGAPKAEAAAAALRRIFPGAQSAGVRLSIPMPGHPIGPAGSPAAARALADAERLEGLIRDADVIFLLTDTRESRWLPTLLAAAHGKLAINAALGFDSYLVMRHGLVSSEAPSGSESTPERAGAAAGAEAVGTAASIGSPAPRAPVAATPPAPAPAAARARLGCYFCSDVVAPADSTSDRTLDQQCTVTRPGLAPVAAALAVELYVAALHHPRGGGAPAGLPAGAEPEADSPLGLVPHQIRGFLTRWQQLLVAGPAFDQCTACGPAAVGAYRAGGADMLSRVFNEPRYLEDLTGLTALQAAADAAGDEDLDWGEEEEDDVD